MKTEKRKSQKKHKRSKKYMGGDGDDMRSSDDWSAMDKPEDNALINYHKNKILMGKAGYGLGFAALAGLVGLVGLVVFKKMK
jgi:hypothetical protein